MQTRVVGEKDGTGVTYRESAIFIPVLIIHTQRNDEGINSDNQNDTNPTVLP